MIRPLPSFADHFHHHGVQRRVRRAGGARPPLVREARASWQREIGRQGAGAVRQGEGQVFGGFRIKRAVNTPAKGKPDSYLGWFYRPWNEYANFWGMRSRWAWLCLCNPRPERSLLHVVPHMSLLHVSTSKLGQAHFWGVALVGPARGCSRDAPT